MHLGGAPIASYPLLVTPPIKTFRAPLTRFIVGTDRKAPHGPKRLPFVAKGGEFHENMGLSVKKPVRHAVPSHCTRGMALTSSNRHYYFYLCIYLFVQKEAS